MMKAAFDMSGNKWLQAAEAIMTTDTVSKLCRSSFRLETKRSLLAVWPRVGMIRPDMATMLSFIACNIRISEYLLPSLVKHVADASFNRITVDGDTSTNDAFVSLVQVPVTRSDRKYVSI